MSELKPVYAIAQLEVLDAEAFFSDYAMPLQSIHKRFGVEVLAASQEAMVVEGHYQQNFTVILKFPSAAVQAAWYADADYQPLIARRREVTDTDKSRMIVIPAFEGVAS